MTRQEKKRGDRRLSSWLVYLSTGTAMAYATFFPKKKFFKGKCFAKKTSRKCIASKSIFNFKGYMYVFSMAERVFLENWGRKVEGDRSQSHQKNPLSNSAATAALDDDRKGERRKSVCTAQPGREERRRVLSTLLLWFECLL